MAERSERRAHREKLLCAAATASATTTATPGSATSAIGMRLLRLYLRHPRFLSLSLWRDFLDVESVPSVQAAQTYVTVIVTDQGPVWFRFLRSLAIEIRISHCTVAVGWRIRNVARIIISFVIVFSRYLKYLTRNQEKDRSYDSAVM